MPSGCAMGLGLTVHSTWATGPEDTPLASRVCRRAVLRLRLQKNAFCAMKAWLAVKLLPRWRRIEPSNFETETACRRSTTIIPRTKEMFCNQAPTGSISVPWLPNQASN